MRAGLPLLLVAIGGALGALARYGLSGWVQGDRVGFPYGTLCVNLLGCLIMGVLGWWLVERLAPAELRLFFGLGVLGGFTTFSSFSFEALQLLRDHSYGPALLYITATTAGCLLMVTLGYALAQTVWG